MSDHYIAHLHPLTNVTTKCQFPTPYGFQDIVRTIFLGQGHYGKAKGQIKVRPWHCTPTTPNQCPYQVSTSDTIRFLRYSPDKIFKLKVKSRSHLDIAHLQPPTNDLTKYQLLTPCGFQDIARTRFSNSRSLWQGQRSNQGHTRTPPTIVPIKYQLPKPYGF